MPTAEKPRYSNPFDYGSRKVVICNDCSTRSSPIMVMAFDKDRHDDYHNQEAQ